MRRLSVLAALLAAAPAAAQTTPVDSLARAFAEGEGLPALVVAVTDGGGRRVYAYGAVAGAAPDAHTPFEIGSVTKAVTALTLAEMAARGEVGLEDGLGDYLPDGVRAPMVEGREVRLVDLATHTSGLPRLPANLAPANPLDPYAGYGPDDLWAFLQDGAPPDAPAAYAYSNLGAGLLGLVLARRAGTSYDALVRERVLAPLGMDETGVDLPEALATRLAPPHAAPGEPTPPWTFTDAMAGAGALRSSADDLLTFLEAFLDPAAVSPASLAEALRTAPEPRHDAGHFSVGLAWHVLPASAGADAPALVFHNGQTFGSAAFAGFAPGRGVGVVVLTNAGLDVTPFALDVLGRLAGRAR